MNGKAYYNFLIKRLAKIYPLHILTFFMVTILLYVGKYYFHQEKLIIRPDHILPNLLLVHAWNITDAISWNTVSWSISAEWFAYLFLFISSTFLVKKKPILGKLLIMGIVLCFIIKWLNIENFSQNNQTFNGLSRIIPEFLLGVFMGVHQKKYKVSKKIASIIFMISFLALQVLFMANFKIDALCIIPFAGIIYALSFPTHFDWFFSSKKIVYLGSLSFAFYMFQITTYYLFKPLNGYFEIIYAGFYIRIFILVLFNLILSALAFKYIEEPSRKYIVKKFSKTE